MCKKSYPIFLFLSLIFLSGLLAGCNQPTISIKPETIVLKPGESSNFHAEITPAGLSSVTYKWSTSEKDDSALLSKLDGPSTKFTAVDVCGDVALSLTVTVDGKEYTTVTTIKVDCGSGLVPETAIPNTNTPDATPTEPPAPSATPIAIPAGVNIVITVPVGNEADSVDYRVSVEGTVENMPADKKLWLFVFPVVTNRYHPAEASVILTDNGGKWTSNVQIGDQGKNSKEKFLIWVALVSPTGEAEIKAYFENAKKSGKYDGFIELPAGIELNMKTTVTRR